MIKIILKTLKILLILLLIYILFIFMNAVLFFTIGPEYPLWLSGSSYRILPIYKMIDNGDIEIIKSRRNIKDQKWEYLLESKNVESISSEFKKLMTEIGQYTDQNENKSDYLQYLTEKYSHIDFKYESFCIVFNDRLSFVELFYNENTNEFYLSFAPI